VAPGNHRVKYWMCPRAGLDIMKQKSLAPARDQNLTIKTLTRFKHTQRPFLRTLQFT